MYTLDFGLTHTNMGSWASCSTSQLNSAILPCSSYALFPQSHPQPSASSSGPWFKSSLPMPLLMLALPLPCQSPLLNLPLTSFPALLCQLGAAVFSISQQLDF